MKCKNCNKDTENLVFCTNECSRLFAYKSTQTDDGKRRRGKKNSQGTKIPKSILDMSPRTVSKLLRRMKISCCICSWNEATCDIHHIIPKKDGGTNDDTNLTILCPNHHRMIHDGKELPIKTVSEHIGEDWRTHYYAHE